MESASKLGRYSDIDPEDDFSAKYEKEDLQKKMEQGKTPWSDINNLKDDDVKKRDEMIDALRDFQERTGISEEKWIKQLQRCTKRSQLKEMEKKFKTAGIKWYELQMRKSGIFEPLDVREEDQLNNEFKGLVKWFKDLPLYGDTSMISTLSDLQKNLTIKKTFRQKLKRQSKFVQSEYFRRLGSLALVGSREQLLDNILKELKEVENAPAAVQHEFKKKQKNSGARKETSEIKKEVMENYKRRADAYKKTIQENQDYFGGERMVTPLGKMPEAAWEFMEWFEDRESFAEMDSALKKLPSLVKERKKLFDKRDKILENALPKEKEKLMGQTKHMRHHELEEFLPEMEKQVRNNSIHVAEYISTLTVARVHNIDLYQPLEKSLAINKFKLNDPETQRAKLIVLREEIEDRARIVREYFALPSYLRNDEAFLRGNSYDREKALLDALERRNREQTEPFDASHIDHMDGEDIRETSEKLKGEKGEEVMEDVIEEMSQEGLLHAAEVQRKTHDKIFGAANHAEKYQETQKEHYLRDLKYWVRMRQDIDDESDVRSERERSKWRYIQAANEAYDLDYVFTSGGEVRKLEKITATDLEHGNAMAEEKLQRARYGEHVQMQDHEGRMAQDPLEIIERLSAQELMKLVLLAINKLGRGHMGLSDSNLTILRNSPNIQKETAARMVEMEMTHMEDSDHRIAA